MSKHLFNTLVTNLCNDVGLPHPEKVINGEPVTLQGVNFWLGYGESFSPHYFYVYCDFAEVSVHKEKTVYRYILEENTDRALNQLPILSISSQTGRVIAMAHFPVATINPKELFQKLNDLAAEALAWRRIDFPFDEDASGF